MNNSILLNQTIRYLNKNKISQEFINVKNVSKREKKVSMKEDVGIKINFKLGILQRARTRYSNIHTWYFIKVVFKSHNALFVRKKIYILYD